MTENKTLTAARAYVARGLAVFPLDGKRPLTEHGVKDATLDHDLIETWFKQPRNIGIAIPEGTVVVDVDPRNGGMDSFMEWVDHYGWDLWADAPNARTGGGGDHYWFRLPFGITKLKKNPAPGIDLLTHGRYVVAPPSVTDEKYHWTIALPRDLAQLDVLPGFVVQLAQPEQRAEWAGSHSGRDMGADPLDTAAHRTTSWEALLTRHDWKPVDAAGTKWRHPNTSNDVSATIKHDCLFVYSPNTPFPVTEPGDPHGITLFSAIVELDYHGDMTKALDAMRRDGHLPEKDEPLRDFSEVLPKKREVGDPTTNGTSVDDSKPRAVLANAEQIVLARVRWAWDGRIPVGGLTLLAGREGEGKSTLAIGLGASLTRGTLEGEYYDEAKDIIIIATEDSLAHTIGPRLKAANADMKRVFFVEMTDPMDTLQLPVHLPDLELACAKQDVGLIIMDPLLSRLSGRLDTHKDSDVRRALEPLVSFADRIHAAILGLIHLNKSGATDPLQAVMASRAFTAVARSVLFAMVDPENENRRLLGLVKTNLGRLDLPTLTYTFDPVEVGWDDGPIIGTRILWGENADTTIRAALEIPAENKSQVDLAEEWLGHWLATQGGSALFDEVQHAAAKNLGKDIQVATLRRAFKRLGGEMRRAGYQGTTVWALPGAPVITEMPRP